YPRLLSHAPPAPQRPPRSLHDALPIFLASLRDATRQLMTVEDCIEISILASLRDATRDQTERSGSHRKISILASLRDATRSPNQDRKSTRLNSSHVKISYAVFCLKKKK